MCRIQRITAAAFVSAAMFSAPAQARDTISCESKHAWQREIVRDAVHGWLLGEAQPDALLALIQAEQGIVACRPEPRRIMRLHTLRLDRGLEVDQLGAVLLANELEWSGLVPAPADGLAGEWFRVRVRPSPLEETGRPAEEAGP